MSNLWTQVAETFAVAFGVVMGGALLGGLAALLSGGYPAETIVTLGDRLKVWAAAAALGGSLINFKSLETGIVRWQPAVILREFGLLGLAFGGSFAAYWLVAAIAGR